MSSSAQADPALPATMQVEPSRHPLSIAIVYSRAPFPMMRGDQLTVSHLIGFLSARGHQVDLLSLNCDGEISPAQREWLEQSCRELTLLDHGWLDRIGGLFSALLRRWPLQVGLYSNRRLNRLLALRLEEARYDIVYIYYIRSAGALAIPFQPGHPRRISGRTVASVLAMQLSQTLNTRRIYEQTHSWLKKAVYGLEWRLIRRFEARRWQRFTATMLIGPSDVREVEQSCQMEDQPRIDNWHYGAHGTDLSRFVPAQDDEVVPGRLVFSGAMKYEPNEHAVLWFIEHCWDAIRQRHPDCTLYIVGRSPSAEIRALEAKPGITVTGTVPDVSEYIRSAAVTINPMQMAGGMQNKLIEYLASAKATVATAVANEGIMARDQEHLLIADTPEDFVEAIASLLDDDARRKALGEAARAFALSDWSWEKHFLDLEANFHRFLAATPEPQTPV